MGLFDRRKLPTEVAAQIRTTTTDRVLSWAHGFDSDEVWLIGLIDRMLVGGPGRWEEIGWHRIARGSWDRETDQMRWTSYDRTRRRITLDDAGDFPEFFRERINASIVLQHAAKVPGDPGDGLVIAARRPLTGGEVEWHVTLGRGTTWQTPGARETGEVILARLRNEYERG
ncbi:hypothetical protein [Enemella sp. A6]|uniref:hypothetical protein n=1 Tax=Enemella sp. A6 TaxID=3440152 RepID=UPI003EBD74D8